MPAFTWITADCYMFKTVRLKKSKKQNREQEECLFNSCIFYFSAALVSPSPSSSSAFMTGVPYEERNRKMLSVLCCILKMNHYYATSHIFSHLSLLPSSGRINNYVFVPSTVKSRRMRNHYSERLFSEPTSVIRSTQHSPLKSMLTGGHRIFSAEGKSGKQSYRPVSSA